MLITTEEKTLLIIGVYMPVCDVDNLEVFIMYLGKIHAIVNDCETSNVMIIDNFNAMPNSIFGRQLEAFCMEFNYSRSDTEFLGCDNDIYTFVSEAHDTVSWLNHCICTLGTHKSILSVKIDEKSPVSDHLPLVIELDYGMVIATSHGEQPIDHNEMSGISNRSNENIRNYTVCRYAQLCLFGRGHDMHGYSLCRP